MPVSRTDSTRTLANLVRADKLNTEIRERCKERFRFFVRQAWNVIEPGTPLVWNWHIDAIAEHLEAVFRGDIHRLVVNIAPGHMKSTLFSTMWPAWCWLNQPGIRWLCASHSLDLAIRDNRNCRMLIESQWYQSHFSDVFQLSGDQNVKSYFENTKRGYRLALSVGAKGTGKRGDYLLIDDPNNATDGDTDMEATRHWFGTTWLSRLNDLQNGAMVVVGQRLHQNDLTGHILELGGWTHLCLPTEYEPQRKCVTVLGNGRTWEDPRTEEGELLWQEKFPEKQLDTLKAGLGTLEYSAQYQQSPIPPGGFIFEHQYERLFSIDQQANLYLLETPSGVKPVVMSQCGIYITSDVAAKAKEQSDYTVFNVWAVTPQKEVLLLYVFRAHLRIPQQVEEGYKTYLAYLDDRFQSFYFEDVAYQSALGQFLVERGVPCEAFHPKADKILRASGASIWMKLGNVYLLKNASWLETWRKEVYSFPKDAHDDQVDPFSMICIIVKEARDVEPMDADTADVLRNFVGY